MKKIVAIALVVASLCVVGCSDKPAAKPTGGAVPSGTGTK